jgi:hypothetical protein
MLKVGDVVRMGDDLWKVEYVNECRARLVPVTTNQKPVNISPNSPIEVVSDYQRAVDEIELEQVERELCELRNAEILDRLSVDRAAAGVCRHCAGPIPCPSEFGDVEVGMRRPAPRGGLIQAATRAMEASLGDRRRYMRYFPGPKPWPMFKAGSLAMQVQAYIISHPGQTTAEIVEGVGAAGAVAACVSRFNQAGFIHKE